MTKKLISLLLLILFILPIFGCGQNSKVVATCSDYEIKYEELRYCSLSIRNNGKTYENEENLKEAMIDFLKENYAVLTLCEEHIPDEVKNLKDYKKDAKSYINEMFDSDNDLKNYLESSYLTKDLLIFELAVASLQSVLRDKVIENTIYQDANTLLQWLKDGHAVNVSKYTFEKEQSDLVNTYYLEINKNNNPTITNYTKVTNNYYLFDGFCDTEAEQYALQALVNDQKSSIVENTDNITLYVLSDFNEDLLKTYQLSAVLIKYQNKYLDEMIESKKEELTISFNDYGNDIDILNID